MTRTSAILVLILALAGCGPKRDPNWKVVVPARGKVTFQGQAAVGARLTFHPVTNEKNAIRPQATVKDDGTFQVTTYVTNDGGPPGEYIVTIVWPDTTQNLRGENDDSDSERFADKLEGKYVVPTGSPIRRTLQKDKPDLEPITLP